MNTIYMIGYAGFERENFVRVLEVYGVNALIDVRSKPYSRHDPEYDNPAMSQFLTVTRKKASTSISGR